MIPLKITDPVIPGNDGADCRVSASAAREEVYKQKASLAKGMNTVLPYLSNLGIIAGQPLKFGSAVAEDGYMTGPINYAPFFYMGVSTYNEC